MTVSKDERVKEKRHRPTRSRGSASPYESKASKLSADQAAKRKPTNYPIFTIGHSTRSIAEFLALLAAHGVKQLVDVRTIPRSRHNPQFNGEELARSLQEAGIEYVHMPELGGLRHARSDSTNTAWRNLSFRGYADYMQTADFASALGKLIRMGRKRRTAIMCAEAVPWRCHRSLIADALIAHGIDAEEISSRTTLRSHKLTPWARVEGTSVVYPAPPAKT